MGKIKTTRNSVQHAFGKCISVDYCRLQGLLSWHDTPIAYTCGRDGWHADVYDMAFVDHPNVAIVTGYAPFGKYEPSYELTRKYERLAAKVKNKYPRDATADEVREELRELIKQFVEEVLDV